MTLAVRAIPNTSDGSLAPPRLRCFMNTLALDGMADFAGLAAEDMVARLAEAGFEGIQFADISSAAVRKACFEAKLGVAGGGRVNTAADANDLADRLASEGMACGTVHLGWGLEDDTEGGRLIEALLAAADRFHIPLYVETHRATLFQDMWRTVQFAAQFPELRFNGDFSHWYTGQEMVYGGFANKLAFIQPVIDRVRFLHGRIGNPGCIQVSLGGGDANATYIDHFRQLWTASFRAFLNGAAAGDFIGFAAELLSSKIFYARTIRNADGDVTEECDRWQDSLRIVAIARECFLAAQSEPSAATDLAEPAAKVFPPTPGFSGPTASE